MDDIAEVLIYALFIIASLGAGIYKNYVKKKEEAKQKEIASRNNYKEEGNSPQEVSTSSFPKSIEDFLNQQMAPYVQESEPEIMSEPIIEEELEEGVAAFETTAQAILSDDMEDDHFSITEVLTSEELINSDAFDNNDISKSNEAINQDDATAFDLQKAVIYSEILKRPF